MTMVTVVSHESPIVSFLKEIGLRLVLEKDKVTIAIGGKQRRLPEPQNHPPSDDSEITGDDDDG